MTEAFQPQTIVRTPSSSRPQTWNQDLTALIQQIRQGDQSAFNALYQATHPLIYGLALRILQDEAAAEDVTIEVYLQLHQQVALYNPSRGTPTAWLLTLTRSRAIDRLRRDAPHGQCESLPEPMPYQSPLPDPETQSVIGERRMMVRQALATLQQEQRQVIEIAYYAGLSHRQIADRLGQPLGTVKTRMRIGIAALRTQLEPLLDDIFETQLETA